MAVTDQVIPIWLPICAALWSGAAIGGFLTVLHHRLKQASNHRSVFQALKLVSNPPSHCPACRRPLGLTEKVPVIGWFRCLGRCLGCGIQISKLYPAIEAASAAVSAMLAFLVIEETSPDLAGIVVISALLCPFAVLAAGMQVLRTPFATTALALLAATGAIAVVI